MHEVWPILLEHYSVCQSHETVLRLQCASASFRRLIEVHCAGAVHLCWRTTDRTGQVCSFLSSPTGAKLLRSLEVDLSDEREEAALKAAAQIGQALQHAVHHHQLQLRTFKGCCKASSRSAILGPISSTLSSLDIVVGRCSWAGLCGSIDEVAGLQDSGLQNIVTPEDTELQHTAATLGHMQHLRSLKLTVAEPSDMSELLPRLAALQQLTKLQLSCASMEDLQQLSCMQLQELTVCSVWGTAMTPRSPVSPAPLAEAAATATATAAEAEAEAGRLDLTHLQSLTKLHCPQCLTLEQGDRLPASLQELVVSKVAAVQPLLLLPQLQLLEADVSDLTAENLLQLASHARCLRDVQLHYCCSSNKLQNKADNPGSSCSAADLAAAAWTSLPVTQLQLQCCMLSADTIKQLGSLSRSLTSLSIFGCQGVEGCSSLQLAAALQQLTRLQQLTLHFSRVAGLPVAEPPEAPAATTTHIRPTAAPVESTDDWACGIANAIASLPCLASVSLVGVPLGHSGALTLAGSRNAANITFAKFAQCALDDFCLSSISLAWRGLKALFVAGDATSSRSSSRSSSSSTRSRSSSSSSRGGAVGGQRCLQISDAVLPAIARLPALRVLMMTGTAVTREGEAFLQGQMHLQGGCYVGP